MEEEQILSIFRKARVKKGFTNLQVASALNISEGAYRSLESGQTSLSLNRFYQLCDLFELDIYEVLSYREVYTDNESKQLKIEHLSRMLKEVREEITYLREVNLNLIKNK